MAFMRMSLSCLTYFYKLLQMESVPFSMVDNMAQACGTVTNVNIWHTQFARKDVMDGQSRPKVKYTMLC